ncbi:Uncharacterized protein TCM_013286 [Theobroma cacao]|uniref:Uncharacterized protein n=1 Tax=Theobroma cacao TaxID=3641 RepID=A0A061G3D0_THECC|nr:Uncharacterized protein TCM_013286 [Theobroma cacao]
MAIKTKTFKRRKFARLALTSTQQSFKFANPQPIPLDSPSRSSPKPLNVYFATEESSPSSDSDYNLLDDAKKREKNRKTRE